MTKVAMCLNLEKSFSGPEEYYRLFAPEQNTVSGLAGCVVTSLPTYPTTSTLHPSIETGNIHQPHITAKSRQESLVRASHAQHTTRTNDTAEEHDTIISLLHVSAEERRSQASTMSSMVSAMSYQELGAIYTYPSKEISTIKSINNLNAKLQRIITLGKPWTRPDPHIVQHAAGDTSRHISNMPLHPRVHDAHIRLNQSLYSPPPSADRIDTQNWTSPSEWLEPGCAVQGPKEWIEEFLNRKEEADRTDLNAHTQQKEGDFFSCNKSIHRLKMKPNKTNLVKENSSNTTQYNSQVPSLAASEPRRSSSLCRSIYIRTLCPTSSEPGQNRLYTSPRSPYGPDKYQHHLYPCQCRGTRSLPALGSGTLVTDTLEESSDGAQGLAAKVSRSLKEGFMCLRRRISFRR